MAHPFEVTVTIEKRVDGRKVAVRQVMFTGEAWTNLVDVRLLLDRISREIGEVVVTKPK